MAIKLDLYEYMQEETIDFGPTPFTISTEEPNTVCIDIDYDVTLRNLSKDGLKLFLYIAKTINADTDVLAINAKEVGDSIYNQINEPTAQKVRRGIKNLLKYRIIAPTNLKPYYFINKNILWKD